MFSAGLLAINIKCLKTRLDKGYPSQQMKQQNLLACVKSEAELMRPETTLPTITAAANDVSAIFGHC